MELINNSHLKPRDRIDSLPIDFSTKQDKYVWVREKDNRLTAVECYFEEVSKPFTVCVSRWELLGVFVLERFTSHSKETDIISSLNIFEFLVDIPDLIFNKRVRRVYTATVWSPSRRRERAMPAFYRLLSAHRLQTVLEDGL